MGEYIRSTVSPQRSDTSKLFDLYEQKKSYVRYELYIWVRYKVLNVKLLFSSLRAVQGSVFSKPVLEKSRTLGKRNVLPVPIAMANTIAAAEQGIKRLLVMSGNGIPAAARSRPLPL